MDNMEFAELKESYLAYMEARYRKVAEVSGARTAEQTLLLELIVEAKLYEQPEVDNG